MKCPEPLIVEIGIRLQVTTGSGSSDAIDITPETQIETDESRDTFFNLFDVTRRAVEHMHGSETARGQARDVGFFRAKKASGFRDALAPRSRPSGLRR